MDKKTLLEEGAGFSPAFERRGGLLPAVVQDKRDNAVLMLAYVNKEALKETLKTGLATFWSTSRNELWRKGDTSGDHLKIVDILVDCDQDALVYVVEPMGAGACHTRDPATGKARRSCFYRKVDLTTGELKTAP